MQPFFFLQLQESAESFLKEAVPGANDDSVIIQKWDPEFGPKVVRVTIAENASTAFATNMRRALLEISYTRFEYDLVDLGPKEGDEDEEEAVRPFKPSLRNSRLVEAIDLFIHSMMEFNYRYKGNFTSISCS